MSLLAELQRRNVVRVAIFYIVASWLALQVADIVLPAVGAPEWVLRVILAALGIAFVPALIFAWAFELTPEGLKREKDVDRSESIVQQTARKLDIAVIVLLVGVAILTFVVPRTSPDRPAPDQSSIPRDAPAAADQATPAGAGDVGRIGIAVLPFANLSGDEQSTPFASGLHDDLLTHLSRIDALRVISRTSVLEYAETTKNVRTIGEELGVSHLMEGGIQRAGDRVRINIQLIDASTDEHLWAETFDRELTVDNIFDIQSAIARQIAGSLRISLASNRKDQLQRPTDNLEAFEAYLLGRSELDVTDVSEESLARIRGHFEEAVRLDPDFALAHAQLALLSDLEFWFLGRNVSKREEGLAHADRALGIQPELPEGFRALASIYYHGYLDYDRALEALGRVEESLAGDMWALTTRGAILRRSGDFETSIPLFEEALSLNPRGPLTHVDLVSSYVRANRFRDARVVAERLGKLDFPPANALFQVGWIEWNRAAETAALERIVDEFGPIDMGQSSFTDLRVVLSALWAAGRQEDIAPYLDDMEAAGMPTYDPISSLRARFNLPFDRQQLESELNRLQSRVLAGDMEPDFKFQIAEALTHLGREQEARNLLTTLVADPLVVRDALTGPDRIAIAAFLFTRLGDLDAAIGALESVLEADTARSLRSLIQIPGMEQLEGHPEFAQLVARFGWVEEDRSLGISL